jgi:hypothetical protein
MDLFPNEQNFDLDKSIIFSHFVYYARAIDTFFQKAVSISRA